MPRGYDRALYILPFDHRASFQTKMLGWKSPLSESQTSEIAAAKRVIYDGFKAALAAEGGSCFLFELLVPAEKAQLDRLQGDKKTYDRELRPRLMVEAIWELQHSGIEPDVWKLDGLDRREDCERMVATARADGRNLVSCIILGRGEDDCSVRKWLATAAGVPGFIGFAVGRTVFWDPLVDYRAKKATREATVGEIARRYGEFVDIFENASRPV